MSLIVRPSMTDDDGSGKVGTVANKALFDAILDEIDVLTHSSTNPTIKPKDIINEVKTARGNKTTLTGRLDVGMDADGNILLPGSAVTQTQAKQLVGQNNVLGNDDFQIWAVAAAAPSFWVLSGTGAAVAQAGTGLADTTRKIGDYCAKITAGSATQKLMQTVISNAKIGIYEIFKSSTWAFGAWVKTSTAAHARLLVDDGNVTTVSSYHTGGGNWEFLIAPIHTVSASWTKLTAGLQGDQTGGSQTMFLSGAVLVNSPLQVSGWIPCPTVLQSLQFDIVGGQTTGTDKRRYFPRRPGVIIDVQLWANTVPTGAALIVDVNTWDGSALTSMFTTRPQIAISANGGAAQPDGTYARRCLTAHYGATRIAGSEVTVDIDQVGSTIAGSDLSVSLMVLHYRRMLDSLLGYSEA